MDSQPTIFALIGPKGAGKSTLGRQLEHQLGIEFLDVEAIFRSLDDPTAVAEGYARVADAAGERIDHGLSVSLELTGAAPQTHDLLDTLATQAPVRLVALEAPLAICLERVRNRDASTHLPIAEGIVEKVHALSTALDLPWDLELDTTHPVDTLVAQVAELLPKIRTQQSAVDSAREPISSRKPSTREIQGRT